MSPHPSTNQSPPIVYRVITWLPVGGIERRLVSIMPRLRDRGFDMRLICIRELGPLAEELKAQNIPVKLIPLKSRLDPFGINQLRKEFRTQQPQIVHAHMYRSSVPATIAAHYARVPVIFSQVHNVGTWESKRQAGMDRFLSKWRTGTIAVSQSVQRDVCQTLSLPADSVPVLYNGSDTEKFQPDQRSRTIARNALGLRDDQLMALVPARLHSNKNPKGVIDAFLAARQHIIRANPDSVPVLLFAGPGPMTDEVQRYIEEREAEDFIRLLGPRDEMPDLYNACDVMILSTFKEGFSNSIVEALACGKPVIAADVGGNREAINDHQVGWIHESGDTEKLAEQITAAFSSPERLAQMAEPCRARGLRFSLDALVDETVTLYGNALAGISS